MKGRYLTANMEVESENVWKVNRGFRRREEESSAVCDMTRWKDYAGCIVNILGLVDDDDINKIRNIFAGSGEYEFKVGSIDKLRVTNVKLWYNVDSDTNKISLRYTKNIEYVQ